MASLAQVSRHQTVKSSNPWSDHNQLQHTRVYIKRCTQCEHSNLEEGCDHHHNCGSSERWAAGCRKQVVTRVTLNKIEVSSENMEGIPRILAQQVPWSTKQEKWPVCWDAGAWCGAVAVVQEHIWQLRNENCEVFTKDDWDTGCIQDLKMEIYLRDNIPVWKTYNAIPQPLYQEVKNHIQDLLSYGWIQKSTSSYSSPVVHVRKKDGSLRLCVVYRLLIEKTPWPKSNPTDPRNPGELGGNSWFTMLDHGIPHHQGFVSENQVCRNGVGVD